MPRRPVTAPRLLAVVALTLSLSACDVVVGGLNAKETATDTWQRTFPIAPDGRFELSNRNGRVDLEATDGDAIEVVAERSAGGSTIDEARDLLANVEIQADASAGLVKITTSVPRQTGLHGNVQVKYRVKVPRRVEVRVTNTNGTVKASGLGGAFEAEITNGTVDATGLAGPVTASTTNGSLEIEVVQIVGDGVRLETTNGSIELRLPRSAKADVRARAVNGRVRTTDVEVESDGESGRRRVEGRLNGGGPLIDLSTVNGGISLVGR